MIRIEPVLPADFPAWDAYVLRHPKGLAYHLSAFGQVVARAYGFKTIWLAAKVGTSVCGVLALTHMTLPGRKGRLISAPYCDAAGVLADDPDVEALLLSEGLSLARGKGLSRLILRSRSPLAGIGPETTRHPGKVRMGLCLPGTEAAFMASLKAKTRSQARKPERDGLCFELGGIQLLSDFYAVFQENMRDLGSPVHSKTFFEEILKHYRNRAHIGLVRLPDQRPAAAGMILVHPRVVSIPWASSLRRFNHTNPNMMLYLGLLKFAVSKKVPEFDFGRSTPGEGTYRFKRQWGAAPAPLHWACFDSRQAKLIDTEDARPSHMRTAAEKIWAGLPIPLATAAGASIRKYISL